jgi:hypothetical protein
VIQFASQNIDSVFHQLVYPRVSICSDRVAALQPLIRWRGDGEKIKKRKSECFLPKVGNGRHLARVTQNVLVSLTGQQVNAHGKIDRPNTKTLTSAQENAPEAFPLKLEQLAKRAHVELGLNALNEQRKRTQHACVRVFQ